MKYYLILQKVGSMSPAPEGAPDSGGHAFVMIAFYLGLFGIFYLLLIRPQMKRNKVTRNMQEELKKGDQIVTTGGIYGTIYKMKEDVIVLEISEGVRIKIQKSSIGNRVKESEDSCEKK